MGVRIETSEEAALDPIYAFLRRYADAGSWEVGGAFSGNRVFRVKHQSSAGARRYVLKICPSVERDIQSAVSAALPDITPSVEAFELAPTLGDGTVLMLMWDHSLPTSEEFGSLDARANAGARVGEDPALFDGAVLQLARLHAHFLRRQGDLALIPAAHRTLKDLARRIEVSRCADVLPILGRLAQGADGDILAEAAEAMVQVFSKLNSRPSPLSMRTVVHGDFTPANISGGLLGPPVLVDWGEAHIGSFAWDLVLLTAEQLELHRNALEALGIEFADGELEAERLEATVVRLTLIISDSWVNVLTSVDPMVSERSIQAIKLCAARLVESYRVWSRTA